MNNEIKEKDIIQRSIECLSNAKLNDTTYEISRDIVLDYITNLQKANKTLLQKSYSDDVIITKAIDWVKKNMYYFPRPDELLNILKGA